MHQILSTRLDRLDQRLQVRLLRRRVVLIRESVHLVCCVVVAVVAFVVHFVRAVVGIVMSPVVLRVVSSVVSV